MSTEPAAARPAPETTAYATPYWTAAREHRLALQRCVRCGRIQHFPRPWCTACLGETMEFIDSTGAGTVYSFTVVRRTANPAFVDRLPYVLALVDLDEGVRIYTGIVGCDPVDVHVGQRVRACFEDIDDAHTVVLFAPATDPER